MIAKTKGKKTTPKTDVAVGEYVSKNWGVVVQDVIRVDIVFDGEKTKGWVHTHGMSKFGMPELEMRNVPLYLGAAACVLVNSVCDYMLNEEGKKFVPGQVYQFGPSRFILAKSVPIPGDEGHFEDDRWVFEEIVPKCAACELGKEHDKHSETLN